ncbi:hypothetical protein HGG76_18180 [Ochrobactrum tritici]|uniref:Uncharacterized protein n=1 Tax=Brucella tritici TaxID=94626 RepID=A0A7X6JCD2_9HYPH|nr:hypothetical protein [Brucella tritici]
MATHICQPASYRRSGVPDLLPRSDDFAKPDGKPVEPTAIDTVDMLPFMNHDAD